MSYWIPYQWMRHLINSWMVSWQTPCKQARQIHTQGKWLLLWEQTTVCFVIEVIECHHTAVKVFWLDWQGLEHGLKTGDRGILRKRHVDDLHSIWRLSKEHRQERGLSHRVAKMPSSVYVGPSLSSAISVLAQRAQRYWWQAWRLCLESASPWPV